MYSKAPIAYHICVSVAISMVIGESASGQVQTGLWVGSVDFNGGPPTAARFEVAADDSLISITPHIPGMPAVPVDAVLLTDDEISFSWTPTSSTYECQLDRSGTDSFMGACISPAGYSLEIHLMPPGSEPVALASHALDHNDFRWVRYATDHMDLYFTKDTYTFEQGRSHRHHAEKAREHALGILGESEYQHRVSVFYVGSLQEMNAVFGEQVLGKPDPLGDAIAVALEGDVILREHHEIMHVVSWGKWGIAREPNGWISEGLAIFAQGRCQGHDIHQLAFSLSRSNDLVPIDTLIQRFWDLDESVAYVQSGSFVRFIHETHGAGALRDLWQEGISQVQAITGRTLHQLEDDWRLHIAEPGDAGLAARWQPASGCRY